MKYFAKFESNNGFRNAVIGAGLLGVGGAGLYVVSRGKAGGKAASSLRSSAPTPSAAATPTHVIKPQSARYQHVKSGFNDFSRRAESTPQVPTVSNKRVRNSELVAQRREELEKMKPFKAMRTSALSRKAGKNTPVGYKRKRNAFKNALNKKRKQGSYFNENLNLGRFNESVANNGNGFRNGLIVGIGGSAALVGGAYALRKPLRNLMIKRPNKPLPELKEIKIE